MPLYILLYRLKKICIGSMDATSMSCVSTEKDVGLKGLLVVTVASCG